MQSSSSKPRSVIVTGSNQGIGLCIVEGLVSGQAPYHVVLTSRNLENGKKAAEEIHSKHPNSLSQITVKQLDITDSKSVEDFLSWIKSDLGTVDVLINNAAIGRYPEPQTAYRFDTFNTNFFKTIELTEKVQPYLSDDGKIIFISSVQGSLSKQPTEARQLLEDPSLTKEKLMEIANKYYKDIQERNNDLIFSNFTYGTSKAILNAYIRWVSVKQVKTGQQVYAVCPGHCQTALGGEGAKRTAAQGADTPVYLVNLPFEIKEEIQGKLLRDREPIGFDAYL